MNGWRPEWASITDPLARFRAMGKGLDLYTAQRVGEMPMSWADQSEWDAYTARKNSLQSDWLNTLSAAERAQWDKDSSFSAAQNKKHMNTGMGITAGLIGLGGGAMALGQLGLLGAQAAGGSAGSAGTGSAVELGHNAGGALIGGDSGWAGLGGIPGPASGTGVLTGAELGAAAMPAAAAAIPSAAAPAVPALDAAGIGAGSAAVRPPASAGSGAGGLLSGIGSAGSSLLDWVAKNPGLTSLLGGALAGIGAGSAEPPTPEPTYAPQPGLNIGALQQAGNLQPTGLFSAGGGPRMANSGLARFGATGGTYTPGQSIPAIWRR